MTFQLTGPLFKTQRQQHVTLASSEAPVTRVHEKHAAYNHRPRPDHGCALSPHAVHRGELSIGIELPDDSSVLGRVSPQYAVVGSRKHQSWDHCDACRLGGAAAALIAALRRPR